MGLLISAPAFQLKHQVVAVCGDGFSNNSIKLSLQLLISGGRNNQKVREFYNRGDISRTDPGYTKVSKKTGRSFHFMEKTLVEAHQIFLQENPGVKLSFSKFAKMRPAETKTTAHNRMQFCLCEYCVRLDMRLASLNKFLSNKDMRHLHLKNRNFANSITLCQKEYGVGFHINCIERKCADCGTSNIKKHLEEVIKEFGQEELSWSVWTKKHGVFTETVVVY